MTDLHELQAWMAKREDENLEFKKAKNSFNYEKLLRYCAALANEGGGKLVLGITDEIPRKVVGSQAFESLERTKAGIIRDLRFRVEIEELPHPEGRVVIFHIPSHPLGMPIACKGAYLMRGGEELVGMTPDQLKRIFNQGQPDFSAEICPGAVLSDISPEAVETFRSFWFRKSGNDARLRQSDEQLLRDAELLHDQGITYAALIMFGTKQAATKYLPQAEVVFEYRSAEASISYQQREEFQGGFFAFLGKLWDLINVRNDLQHYQDGLFIWDIPTFSEEVVREALLNAVSHRDYRLGGSIFVRQFPAKLEIINPGGLPEGITPDNIIYKQNPRNRRVAQCLQYCGLVERSGQGFDKIFESCIKESKPKPDFSGTDNFQVSLTLQGTVENPQFLSFLAQIGNETQQSFGIDDFQVLDLLSRGERIPQHLISRINHLQPSGVIESIGRGRGVKYILSKRFYSLAGKPGAYTRTRGLDKEHGKMLLLEHLKHYGRGTIKEFEEALPSKSRRQIWTMLEELKANGLIRYVGPRRGGWWERIR